MPDYSHTPPISSNKEKTAEGVHNSDTAAVTTTRIKRRHSNFAGRFPAGTTQAVTLAKNGQRHVSSRIGWLDKAKTEKGRVVLSVRVVCWGW